MLDLSKALCDGEMCLLNILLQTILFHFHVLSIEAGVEPLCVLIIWTLVEGAVCGVTSCYRLLMITWQQIEPTSSPSPALSLCRKDREKELSLVFLTAFVSIYMFFSESMIHPLFNVVFVVTGG